MQNSHHQIPSTEAGNHPLPTDAREIQAVLRAGERYDVLHPYFVRRYGERGRAFTRSDGGYLVTLADQPQDCVSRKVVWLARILASRGMPRWLMEEYLDVLHDELVVARPDRAVECGKLLHAAQELRSARLAWLPQSDFDELASSFDAHVDNELRNAGGLLVGAICDDCCGLTSAVSSLLYWLINPDLFSLRWIEAVAETITKTSNRIIRI